MTVLHAERLHGIRFRRLSPWTWLSAGAALGFAVPFVFADVLDLQRDVYYGIYAASTLALVAAWLRAEGRPLGSFLARRWTWGLGLGVLAGAVMILVAVNAEEASGRPGGVELAAAILWRGVVYGAIDGLLLSVFPILVVYTALRPERRRLLGKVAVGLAALAASLVMTAVYHAGYSDFRSAQLRSPVAGDVVWSMPTLVTASPLGAPVAHVALHVTAVVHSYDTDLFLPPHPSE
jgi:hypothetical protein